MKAITMQFKHANVSDKPMRYKVLDTNERGDILAFPPFDREQATWLTKVADTLARDNARFDRDHFMAVVRGEKDLTSRPSPRSNQFKTRPGFTNPYDADAARRKS